MLDDAITELERYGLSIRVVEKLDDHGYVWVRDLMELTAEEFLGWHHTGELMLLELKSALRRYLVGDKPVKTVGDCVWFPRSGLNSGPDDPH
jgi:hypothetical protein